MATSQADPQVPVPENAVRPADRRRRSLLPALLAAVSIAAAVGAIAQQPAKPAAKTPPPPAAQKAEPPKPAAPGAPPGKEAKKEEPKSNIKVLHGVGTHDIAPIMHVMRASLGVRCDYCHEIENERWDLDTKPAKQTARDMVQMVEKINQEFFAGETVVTCQTCHHGQIRPAQAPPVELGLLHEIFPGEPLGGPSQRAATNLPGAADVLDRYIEALGGRAALEGVRSRVSRGFLLHAGVLNAGTPLAHAGNRAATDRVEIVQRLPDKVTIAYGQADGRVEQTYAGKTGSLKNAKGSHEMPAVEAARVTARYDLRRDLKLRDQAEAARVIRRETIDGRETWVVETTGTDGDLLHLFFDTETGLLRRQIAYRPTVIGPYPEQTDYDDYRDVDGVMVPYLIKFSVLDDLHAGYTRRLTQVRQNVEEGARASKTR
jgi:photosynthetic reaction center cytochrome c subunit